MAINSTEDFHAIHVVKKEYGEALTNLNAAILEMETALAANENLIKAMKALREAVDALETITDDNVWPLPKYREMLFIC